MRLTTGRLLFGIGLALSCGVCSAPIAQSVYEHLPDEQVMGTTEKEILEEDAAKNYMLKLINRDRASLKLPPVALDEIAAAAGKIHSDEMAANGYSSHWTMDGRKPDQRYSEAGGKDAVAENVYVTLEGSAAEGSGELAKLPLQAAPVFRRYELEQVESGFFNEKPPYDGHRKTIIAPQHNFVGIGLSFASAPGAGVRTSCTQEFLSRYGAFGDIPKVVKAGDSFKLTGKLAAGVQLDIVDLRWEAAPRPMTLAELNKTGYYSIPEAVTATFLTDPRQSPEPIKIQKSGDIEEFSLLINIDKSWKPGLYYLCLWGLINGGTEESPLSTRTFTIVSN
jgi:hypothetical protein